MTAYGQVPSRGVLRLASGKDREKGGVSRRSPAGEGKIGDVGPDERLEPWCGFNRRQNDTGNYRGRFRRVHLAFGKQTKNAAIGRCLSIVMQRLVKRAVRGQHIAQQNRSGQYTSQDAGGNEPFDGKA
jgi:hypothetical protein